MGRRRRLTETPDRPRNMTRALLWTAASTVLPGAAHLRVGRRWAGAVILTCYLLLVAVLVSGALVLRGDLVLSATLATQDHWLLLAGITAFAVAVLWMTVVVHSYVITRPESRGLGRRLAAGVVVTALCLTVATPAAAVGYASYTAYDLSNTLFGSASGEPHDDADPWNGQDRVNVLLLGGDAGQNRYGMRTDTMIVASIDVETGDVLLIGLPRNLENVPFPPGSALAERYPAPYGFTDLLNEVYQAVADDPTLALNPYVTDPAADTLKQVIGAALALDIDYYALVDMQGFEDIIDAIGGIRVYLEEPLPYGQRGEYIDAGWQTLDGREALWYGRTRVNSDDYSRMGRQGCLIKYVAEQADPATILTSFRSLAAAAKSTLRTDIPQPKLPHFVELAEKVAEADMDTLQLSPPQVNTAYPDWERIRELVRDAVHGAPEPTSSPSVPSTPSTAPGTDVSADASAESSELTEWQEYTGLPEPSPDSPGRQVGEEATALDDLCP
ncbi:LytR family transcriptional regulator [Thermobifida alba]|uniref:LytR family transcriptional regulator n=2 Tax=Thermobifida alba TaxID=53522 RepID=A0ABY4KXU2_THEAE|nr:LCP family protein [Thermobifida alba]UPT20236.1 LytR family transcriptional regulator [Thermobifida alba]